MNDYDEQAIRLMRQAFAGYEAGDEHIYNALGSARHARALVARGVLSDDVAREVTETLAHIK